MADVDLQLVREFFELNRFQVTTHWRQHDTQAHPEGGQQLFVENAQPADGRELDVVLHPSDLASIQYAVVEVRAWHTDRFYASVIDANPIVTQFAEPWALAPARDFFGTDQFATILVVSELPRTPEQRNQAVQRLAGTGVNHLIEFPAILNDLAQRVVLSGTYTGSPTLQFIQLLKRYKLLRHQQLEFTFPMDAPVSAPASHVDTAVPPESNDDPERPTG